MDEINRINNLSAGKLDDTTSNLSFLSNLTSRFGNIISGASSAIIPGALIPKIADTTEFSSLIDKQIYWQMQMQTFTAESNIEKSRHEVLMSPIRNLRVS